MSNETTKIYIGLSQGKSLPSRIIKWFQWGNPNTHIFYIKEDEIEDPIVIEAVPFKGIVYGKLSENHSLATAYNVYALEVTLEEKEIIERYLLDQVGKKYDFLGILGFGLRRGIQSKNRKFCSELIYEALIKADIKLFRTLKPHSIPPSLFIEPTQLSLIRRGKTIKNNKE